MAEQNETIEDILTPKQERFCFNYTQNYELFSNATLAYAEAYGYDLNSMPDDDGTFLLKDGTIMTKAEINQLDRPDLVFNTAKKLTDSTYKRNYDNCSQLGSRLRRNEKIQAKCRTMLNEFMNDSVIDARLTEIIIDGKHADSLTAIREYNKLKQRIVDKVDHTSKGEAIGGFNFLPPTQTVPQETNVPTPNIEIPDDNSNNSTNNQTIRSVETPILQQ